MGKIAKKGIFGGKKVAVEKIKSAPDSVLVESKIWDAFAIKEQVDKLIHKQALNLEDLKELVNLNFSCLMACKKLVTKDQLPEICPVLYLPIDRWLQVEDPFEVITRSVRYIENVANEKLVLVLGMKDFSHVNLFWPEIIKGIRTSVPHITITGPTFSELVVWCKNKLGLDDRGEILKKVDSILAQIKKIGIDQLFGYTGVTGSPFIKKHGFVLNYALEIDRYPDAQSLAQELFRQSIEFQDTQPNSWSVSLSRHIPGVSEADRLRLLQTLLIGAILFKTPIRAPWITFDGSEIDLYPLLGVNEIIYAACDEYTSKKLKLHSLEKIKAKFNIDE